MIWRVPLADLDYGEEENRAVLDVLNRRWLTMGEVTQQFEAAIRCCAWGEICPGGIQCHRGAAPGLPGAGHRPGR